MPCKLCDSNDRFAFERLIASGQFTMQELAYKSGCGLTRGEFITHRDEHMGPEVRGLERRDPKDPKAPRKERTIKERADDLHRQLNRCLKVATREVVEKKAMTPEAAGAIKDIAGEVRNSIELSAKLAGDLEQKGTGGTKIQQVFMLPTTHGKSEEERQRMITDGVQSMAMTETKQ